MIKKNKFNYRIFNILSSFSSPLGRSEGAFWGGLIIAFLMTSCVEIDYLEIENPAYVRVFNNLNYEVTLENRFENIPFLTMLIDPEFDENGVPVSAAIVGDFLDEREKYAAPYPVHSSNSVSYKNPEYPGRENVLVGPILNGFDLSSWAQIPEGEHRVVFYFRPLSETAFFSLEKELRTKVAVDTVINLKEREVYTLHVLQKDFVTKENTIILRQEEFHKIPLADSLVYLNFYNMSANGFYEDGVENYETTVVLAGEYGTLEKGVPDGVNVYLSLFPSADSNIQLDDINEAVPGYYRTFLTSIRRDTESSRVNPYFHYPLFGGKEKDDEHIQTEMFQMLNFLAPGLDPYKTPYGQNYEPNKGFYHTLLFYKDGLTFPAKNVGAMFYPNMIVNVHSGNYNPRSFATVNTVEIVNGRTYLMTIQRKYDPPVY